MTPSDASRTGCVLFDWGDTLMRDFPEFSGPMATWPRVESMPHASEALVAVRRLGWMTALATNAADSDESQIWLALQRAGLAPLLDAVYCSQNVGHRKPSADFFGAILSDLALDPFNVVMVGDDYEVDVVGANACGIRAIWLASELEDAVSATLCRSVTSLAEVPGVLEQWGRERT